MELQGLLTTRSYKVWGNTSNRLSNVGKLKAVIVEGVFIQRQDSRVDLLRVGDGLKKSLLIALLK